MNPGWSWAKTDVARAYRLRVMINLMIVSFCVWINPLKRQREQIEIWLLVLLFLRQKAPETGLSAYLYQRTIVTSPK
jgi:hypothetical protein